MWFGITLSNRLTCVKRDILVLLCGIGLTRGKRDRLDIIVWNRVNKED
jgi:hypothetical protein